jgi:hypothetical protein
VQTKRCGASQKLATTETNAVYLKADASAGTETPYFKLGIGGGFRNETESKVQNEVEFGPEQEVKYFDYVDRSNNRVATVISLRSDVCPVATGDSFYRYLGASAELALTRQNLITLFGGTEADKFPDGVTFDKRTGVVAISCFERYSDLWRAIKEREYNLSDRDVALILAYATTTKETRKLGNCK